MARSRFAGSAPVFPIVAMTFSLFLAEASQNPIIKTIAGIAEQFGANWWGLFCQIVSFCIVAFLLSKFAYKPILAVLEERRQKIQESLDNAKKIQEQLAQAQKTAEDIRAQANVDASKFIEEARAAAKQISERENQRAVQQAAEIVAKAREAGEAEQRRLMAELKKELSRLIVDTTAKVTGKVLTAADQKKITEEANKELSA
jgi:F-type H+-transporting ATPase subunit b